MATYYFNGAAILAPFTITSNEPTYDMTTVSLKTQRASQNHQRWELSFSVQPTGTDIADTFIGQLGIMDTTQTMIMPQLKDTLEAHTLTVAVATDALYSAGASVIGFAGTGITGVLPKGSFIKFAGATKVYLTTTDLTFDNVSNPTCSIYPSLRSDVAITTTLNYKDACQITYHQSIDNATGVTFTDGILANPGTIQLIEAL